MGHAPRRIHIETEDGLGGLKPPYEFVRAVIEAIARSTAGAAEDMNEIHRDRLNNEILNLRSGEKSRTNQFTQLHYICP
jgi:hypothetical protein